MRAKCDAMIIKIAFFQKLRKIAQRTGGSAPQTLFCDTFELQYTSLLKHVSQFKHFRNLTIGLKLSLNEFLVTCQHQATASDLPFYDIFAPRKIPFSKFLMASLHVICGLGPPPIKNSGYACGVHR